MSGSQSEMSQRGQAELALREARARAVDEGYAPERWEFDEEVTRVFDDMLKRSIPQYDVMRSTVLDIASRYVMDGAHVVDLGASRGEATAQMVERHGSRLRYVAVECSPPMLKALRDRFHYSLTTDYGFPIEVLDMDLRKGYPERPACVTLAVLSIQFTPIEHRQRIIRDAWKNTVDGGALILVEKVLGATAETDAALVDIYYQRKRAEGYTDEQVERKRLALEGVLVPVTAAWNEDLLRRAGFEHVDCFWRWSNFAAWVAVKGR